MAKAITDKILLPKWIIIVLDNDLINYVIAETEYNRARVFDGILDNIMKQHDRYIDTQKEFLLEKSKKGTLFPQIVWIEPPMHDLFPDNDACFTFSKSLIESVKYHKNTTSLSLKKAWDPQDT